MAEKKKQKSNVIADLRELDEKALVTKIAELKKQLVEQHRSHAAQELPGSHVIGKTRKEIAKAMTVLGEVTRAAQNAKKEEKK